jgi:hypothetical protein
VIFFVAIITTGAYDCLEFLLCQNLVGVCRLYFLKTWVFALIIWSSPPSKLGWHMPTLLFDPGAFALIIWFSHLFIADDRCGRMSANDLRGWGHLCYCFLFSPPHRAREPFGFIVCFSQGCFCSVTLALPMAASAGTWRLHALLPTSWSKAGRYYRQRPAHGWMDV